MLEQQNLTDEDLRRGGEYEVRELSAPDHQNGHNVPLLLCRPTASTQKVGLIYFIHGEA
jgi:hypothetical protein